MRFTGILTFLRAPVDWQSRAWKPDWRRGLLPGGMAQAPTAALGFERSGSYLATCQGSTVLALKV
jgi:hypothetical protein